MEITFSNLVAHFPRHDSPIHQNMFQNHIYSVYHFPLKLQCDHSNSTAYLQTNKFEDSLKSASLSRKWKHLQQNTEQSCTVRL